MIPKSLLDLIIDVFAKVGFEESKDFELSVNEFEATAETIPRNNFEQFNIEVKALFEKEHYQEKVLDVDSTFFYDLKQKFQLISTKPETTEKGRILLTINLLQASKFCE